MCLEILYLISLIIGLVLSAVQVILSLKLLQTKSELERKTEEAKMWKVNYMKLAALATKYISQILNKEKKDD